jgi:hypothetical protein
LDAAVIVGACDVYVEVGVNICFIIARDQVVGPPPFWWLMKAFTDGATNVVAVLAVGRGWSFLLEVVVATVASII